MCYADIRRKMEVDFRFTCLGAIQPVGHLDFTVRRGQPHFPYMLYARIMVAVMRPSNILYFICISIILDTCAGFFKP